MLRLKNILVALDGSSSSFHALEEAIRLSQWGRGRVTAITVAPPYEGDLNLIGVKNIRAAMEGPSEEVLSKALEIAEACSARLDVICEEGEAHHKIVEHAEAKDCDLIVLGASSRKSLAGSILGCVGPKVIQLSSRDVLAIPENVPLGWERILLATDPSEYGQSAGELALELAASYGGGLKAVFLPKGFHCSGKTLRSDSGLKLTGEVAEAYKARAEQAGIRCDHSVVRNNVYKVLHDHARNHAVTLIILGFQKRTRLLGLVQRNLADRLISGALCPVLVVKARHEAAESRTRD